MHEPFTLLLSVYDGDRPDHLRRAFRSAVDDQTLRPAQVVIVAPLDDTEQRPPFRRARFLPYLFCSGAFRFLRRCQSSSSTCASWLCEPWYASSK